MNRLIGVARRMSLGILVTLAACLPEKGGTNHPDAVGIVDGSFAVDSLTGAGGASVGIGTGGIVGSGGSVGTGVEPVRAGAAAPRASLELAIEAELVGSLAPAAELRREAAGAVSGPVDHWVSVALSDQAARMRQAAD